MLEVLPFARNIEEASALAQYFTLVAASRNHHSAQKKLDAVVDQLEIAKTETVKEKSVSRQTDSNLSKNFDESLDASKGQNINILF